MTLLIVENDVSLTNFAPGCELPCQSVLIIGGSIYDEGLL